MYAQSSPAPVLAPPANSGMIGAIGRAAENRQPEMQLAVSTLEDRVADLEKLQEVLHQRLGVILRSEPPNDRPAQPEYSGSTAVTQSIASVTNRVSGLVFRTRQMLDLLEL